jgi:hypothetical protein
MRPGTYRKSPLGLSTPMRMLSAIAVGFTLFSSIFCAPVARAALGEHEWSVESDRAALSATSSGVVLQRDQYTVHELNSNGSQIHEYLDRNGTVFGVAWSGRMQPDLSSLLGNYMDDFQSSMRTQRTRFSAPRPRAAHSQVHGSKVVVERFGHMGAQRGRAYVPSLMPTGVNAHDLR